MIRTQVQVTDEQMQALRRLSAATGDSIAELVRRGVDKLLDERRESSTAERLERAIRVAGRFGSGRADVSAEHDRYLAEAIEG